MANWSVRQKLNHVTSVQLRRSVCTFTRAVARSTLQSLGKWQL